MRRPGVTIVSKGDLGSDAAPLKASHPCAAGSDDPRMWRPLSLLSLLLATGCGNPQSLSTVPVGPGGQCKISVGDVRSHVRVRCGGPCASQTYPDGVCPQPQKGTCENQCDVYQDVEVCFAGDRVVMLDRLDRVSGRQSWCFWPDPNAGRPRARAR